MGVYMTVNLEVPTKGFDLGTGIHSTPFMRLIDVASEAGYPTPDSFISKLFAEYLEEEPPPDMVDRWFTPQEGIDWSRGIRKLLAQRNDDPENDSFALECLDEFDEKIQFAKSINSRWNLFAF